MLSLSATLAAARATTIPPGQALYLTRDGLTLRAAGDDPDESVVLGEHGSVVDWDEARRDVIGWAETWDVVLGE